VQFTAVTEGLKVFDKGDEDSAIRSSHRLRKSTFITFSVQNYVYENKCQYHAYCKGKYILLNNKKKQVRLDLQHHIFRLMLKKHLFKSLILNL